MSPIEAPPLANAGLEKSPVRKRSTSSPAKLSTTAVGIESITNKKKVGAYTQFRPTAGISDNGANKRGPTPYPTTYRARPRDAGVALTWNLSATSASPGTYMLEAPYAAKE